MTGVGTSVTEKKYTDCSPEPQQEYHSDSEDNRADPKRIECPVDRSNEQSHKERPRHHYDTWLYACP